MSLKLVIGLRGLTRGNIHWGSFPEVIKEVAPGLHFLPLEMAGNGTRSTETSQVNPERVIQDLRNQLQQWVKSHPEFQSAKVNILALSLGGMIGLKWAELYPEEVDQLIVVNSSLKQLSPFNKRLFPVNYLSVFRTLGFGSTTQQEELILRLTSNNISLSQEYLPLYIESAKKNKFRLRNFFRQLVLASRIKILKPLSLKPIFICSEKDRLVNASCSYDLNNKFNGTLYTHELAGHDLPLDHPAWLAEKISFLQNPPQNH